MKLSKVIRQLRGERSAADFGKDLGVSQTAIFKWEDGEGVGPFNRMRLLEYAKRTGAAREIVDALEAAQPELRA